MNDNVWPILWVLIMFVGVPAMLVTVIQRYFPKLGTISIGLIVLVFYLAVVAVSDLFVAFSLQHKMQQQTATPRASN